VIKYSQRKKLVIQIKMVSPKTAIFPEMPEAPSVEVPELPNLIDPKFRISRNSIAIAIGVAILAVVLAILAYFLAPYLKQNDASLFSFFEFIGKFNLEWFKGIKWPWQ
jgi:hypothetical protein